MTRKIIALVVAGGCGSRFGGEIPKQYQVLGGVPLLQHALHAFAAHPEVSAVRAVIREEDAERYQQCIQPESGLLEPVFGGAERQDSVRRGLESLHDATPDIVLIHDAARPLVSAALISRVIEALEQEGTAGAVPALPVSDTLKRVVAGGLIGETLDRSQCVAVQTPQGFAYRDIMQLHERYAGEAMTDDAMLMERAGLAVRLVEGECRNRKLTTPEQWEEMMPLWQAGFETRCGNGYDFHRLRRHDDVTPAAERVIRLCGVDIPHAAYLEGHSDADVGLHALVDAILGAMGEGDIGVHFPPNDNQWKGVDSACFVKHAAQLLRQRGGVLTHVDITLIAEKPKLKPHYAAMRQAIAGMLGVEMHRVSVKSTTREGMGDIGREEAIAAFATATLRLPAPVESGGGHAVV